MTDVAGSAAAVAVHMSLGAFLDAADQDSRTALHIASAQGFAGVVDELLRAQVDVDKLTAQVCFSAYCSRLSEFLTCGCLQLHWRITRTIHAHK
jgi:hypothetical protein